VAISMRSPDSWCASWSCRSSSSSASMPPRGITQSRVVDVCITVGDCARAGVGVCVGGAG
jgi:hypothetical protein